jgi:hypothetical protein
MTRLLLVLWLVMPLGRADCGAHNTTTKGPDSMKIRPGKIASGSTF